MDIAVSIIVPVYNVEKYLSKCIDSILAQTFTDFELILVDDGSTDNCGKICNEYAEKDGRVIIFHTENRGVSEARNTGLGIAKGKYVYFIDSDDYIDDNLLSECIPYMESGYDAVAFGCYLEYDDGSVKTSWYYKDLGKIFRFSSEKDKFNFINTSFLSNRIGASGALKIYRRDIIETYHIRFESRELTYAEDVQFMLYYIPHINSICTLRKYYYHYFQRDGSSVHQGRYAENIGRVDVLCRKVWEYYQNWEDCRYLTENFSLIYFMVMKIHIDEYQQYVSHDAIETRKVIFENLTDTDFFEKNIRVLKKYKKLLLKIYGKYTTHEIFRDYRYYLKGNRLLLLLTNAVDDRLYKFRKSRQSNENNGGGTIN